MRRNPKIKKGEIVMRFTFGDFAGLGFICRIRCKSQLNKALLCRNRDVVNLAGALK